MHSPCHASLPEGREAFVFDFAGIDWARIALPPTREPVIDRIEGDAAPEARHAEMVRAYYAPAKVLPDGDRTAGRVRRIAAQHVVIVSQDGTALATWSDKDDHYRTGPAVPAQRSTAGPPAYLPRTYAEILDLLAAEGTRVSRHCWEDHWRVHTPHGGRHVFLPTVQVAGDDPAADADLLTRFGALACLVAEHAPVAVG